MLDFTKNITPHASMVDANWQLMLEHAARFDAMDNDNVPEGGLGFDMRFTHYASSETEHPCGSACCIIGWASIWDGRELDSTDGYARGMGLDQKRTGQMALGHLTNRSVQDATPQQAAHLIRHLVATGEVDWPLAMEAA